MLDFNILIEFCTKLGRKMKKKNTFQIAHNFLTLNLLCSLFVHFSILLAQQRCNRNWKVNSLLQYKRQNQGFPSLAYRHGSSSVHFRCVSCSVVWCRFCVNINKWCTQMHASEAKIHTPSSQRSESFEINADELYISYQVMRLLLLLHFLDKLCSPLKDFGRSKTKKKIHKTQTQTHPP